MTMPLTREQVEHLIPLTNMDAQTVNVGGGDGYVGVYTALLLMIDTDAALRQQLEQSQQLVTDGHEAIGHWQGEVYHLRQLLVDEKAIADHNLTDCHEAEHKIEQLQQRVQELEQALRLHLAVAKDDPILPQHDRKEPS